MHLLVVLLADLALAAPDEDCALARALVPALDSYCATNAAPSEQRSCRIARSHLRQCSNASVDAHDGQVYLDVHDERIDGPCGLLFLHFEKRQSGYRLESFSRSKSVCDCDCCP